MSARGLRRAAGVLAVVVGVLGAGLCAAGVVACWVGLPALERSGTRLCERAEKLLGVTAESLSSLRGSLGQARADLAAVREAEVPNAAGNPLARRTAARQLARRLGPRVGDAQQTLQKVSDGAVVLAALLEGLDEIPFARLGQLDVEQLEEAGRRLPAVAASARQLEALLADAPGGKAAEADEHAARMEQGLAEAAGSVEALSGRVAEARDRVEWLQLRLTRWPVAAVVLTVLLVWMGLGQVSLAAHGWSWARKGEA